MNAVAAKVQIDTFQALFDGQRAASHAIRIEPVGKRVARLKALRRWILEHRQELATAVFEDFKKPPMEVETSEVFPVLGELNHAIDHLPNWVRPRKVDAPLTYLGTRAEIRFEPKGVCLIIAPWNYPFNLCIGPLVSCLAAGNTAIIKPSEMTPNTSRFISKMIATVFKPDVVAVAEGDSATASSLLKLPFDHIFFTGSPAVGKVVMRAASEHLSSVTLELGGKSPAIVEDTANLKDAAERIAFGKFLNNGQTCIAPDYVLITESIKQEFVGLLQKEVIRLFGRGQAVSEESPDYARIIHQRHFTRLNGLVQEAIQRGAKPHITGQASEGELFFPPTILTDVPLDCQLMEEEIFGPVLPVIGIEDRQSAIDVVNSKPKPLALYLFSNDRKFRAQVLRSTTAGAVCVNDCVIQFTHPNLPFGGVNHSGIGKAHGYYGFQAFSNEKPVIRQKSGLTNAFLFYPPYSAAKRKILDFVMRWIL